MNIIINYKQGIYNGSINNIHLKTFRGATCEDMTEQNLMELLFTWVLDVSAKRKRPSDVADSIISVGKKCQDTGVRNVMISSLVRGKSPRLQAKINEVNDVLRDLCTIDGFVFIDNTNLSNCDICEDLLNLNYSGNENLQIILLVA